MIFNDGSYYQGMFKDNIMNGLGKYVDKDGKSSGKIQWADGT